MIIAPDLISKLKHDTYFKAGLVGAMNRHYATVERWINDNADNGPLTTYKSLEAIKKQTGLNEDQILQEAAGAKIRKPRKPRSKVLNAGQKS